MGSVQINIGALRGTATEMIAKSHLQMQFREDRKLNSNHPANFLLEWSGCVNEISC